MHRWMLQNIAKLLVRSIGKHNLDRITYYSNDGLTSETSVSLASFYNAQNYTYLLQQLRPVHLPEPV